MHQKLLISVDFPKITQKMKGEQFQRYSFEKTVSKIISFSYG